MTSTHSFAPGWISESDLVKLPFSHLCCVLASILLATTSVAAQQQQLGRGHRFVRSDPFWTSALTQNKPLFEVPDYRGAGLNTLLAWGRKRVLFEKALEAKLPIH